MLLDASTFVTFAILGGVGALAGFVGGFIARADNLFEPGRLPELISVAAAR